MNKIIEECSAWYWGNRTDYWLFYSRHLTSRFFHMIPVTQYGWVGHPMPDVQVQRTCCYTGSNNRTSPTPPAFLWDKSQWDHHNYPSQNLPSSLFSQSRCHIQPLKSWKPKQNTWWDIEMSLGHVCRKRRDIGSFLCSLLPTSPQIFQCVPKHGPWWPPGSSTDFPPFCCGSERPEAGPSIGLVSEQLGGLDPARSSEERWENIPPALTYWSTRSLTNDYFYYWCTIKWTTDTNYCSYHLLSLHLKRRVAGS